MAPPGLAPWRAPLQAGLVLRERLLWYDESRTGSGIEVTS